MPVSIYCLLLQLGLSIVRVKRPIRQLELLIVIVIRRRDV